MRTSSLLLQLALATTAAAQIAPPSWGVVQHAGHQAVEIQGLPGSWLAVPASLGPVDAVSSSPSQICWTHAGSLNIRNRQTGATRTIAVPAGPARFAFDSQGTLAAVWFTAAGQLYTAAAGWTSVLSIPSAASQLLDLSNPGPGAVQLLLRPAGGGRRAAAEAASDRPGSRIAIPVRTAAVPDLQLLVVDALTGQTRTETALADRSGPAALDSTGAVVFAADAGLPTVDPIQHLDHGWLLLTAAARQYAWRRGMRPQATADPATAGLQVQPAPVCNSDGSDCTITIPDTPVGIPFPDLYGYQLINNSPTTVCLLSDKGFCPNANADGSCPDPDLNDTFVDHGIPDGADSNGNPESIGFGPIPWALASGMQMPLPIQFTPQEQITYNTTLTIEYYLPGSASCQSTLPTGAAPLYLQIPFTGTGTQPLPGPVLSSISPISNLVGAPVFTLTLYGGNFEPGPSGSQALTQVLWNGTPLTNVTYVSATQLTATVATPAGATLMTLPGAATVQVRNPAGSTYPGSSGGIVFSILGAAPPTLPSSLQLTLVLDQPTPASNSQVKVSVTLNQNAPAGGFTGGLLTLTFTPAANLADDPSIFLDGNLQDTRAQPFTVPAGASAAAFGTQNFVMLDTGTTAGTFTLIAALGDKSAQWGPYTITPAAPTITSSTLGIAAGGIQLVFQGFDASQSTSGLSFEFYATDGTVVSPGLITMDSSSLISDFSTYYKANTLLGGKFQLTANFPVTGDVTQIATATVTLTNPTGTVSASVPVQ
jgi:hypothetical protein